MTGGRATDRAGSVNVECGGCGADLHPANRVVNAGGSCPSCGSTNRLIRLLVEGRLDFYTKRKAKQKRPGQTKPIWEEEVRYGPGLDGKVVRLRRSFDRINYRYTEHVELPDGTVIVDKDEDLRGHRSSSEHRVSMEEGQQS